MPKKYDFSGWVTRNDIKCSDGRTIRRNAFQDCDGKTVPLVWQHMHDDPANILGHMLLENRNEGVYGYGAFNSTENADIARDLVSHGDIVSMSIYANQLKQSGGDVLHGTIREVSLVLASANPGAYIEFPTISHSGEPNEEEAIIFHDDETIYLAHEENDDKDAKDEKEEAPMNKEKTIGEIMDTLTDEQRDAVSAVVADILEQAGVELGDDDEDEAGDENVEHSDEGADYMKHNVFEGSQETENARNTLTHAQAMTIINDAKRYGSLRDSFLAHTAEYGIDQIDWLFPEAKNLNNPPEFIKRDMDWVAGVMAKVHHTPFSRIKTMQADITEDEARAKGYIKGHQKKNEVFTLLKRSTDPQTIYKKQKLDRDDMIDITDFDIVSWLKAEMRMMLDEEIARAILVGDGRQTSDEDHISEDHIRSVRNDADLYSVKCEVVTGSGEDKYKNLIKAAVRFRKLYKGSGSPSYYTTEDVLAEMLLLEDGIGHRLYNSVDDLCKAMRVSEIVTVPVMENLAPRTDSVKNKSYDLLGIMVNLRDYNVGADKGGAINMFDDFDIDVNQQKYLIETRCSGALVKPFSALVFEEEHTTSGT